jgi:WD40 repeat protein
VRVWNVADAKELLPLVHPAEVLSLSFSADKTRIATGAADRQTRLWDTATGKELEFFAQPDAVRAVVLHPNNKDVVSGAGKAVTVESAAVVRVVLVGAPVHALTLTPNATHALTAGDDKLVTFWNIANGNKDRTVPGSPAPLHAVTVSKNLTLIATGGADKTVRLYNFADGKEVKTVQTPGPVRALSFSPNNLALAAACADRSLVVWNTAYTPGQPLAPTFLSPMQTFAHGDGATDLVFAADNATLWSGGTDRTVRTWKVAADAPVRNFPHPNIVDTVAFHPTAPLLASGGHDGKVRFFDLVKGVQVREINAHPTPNATMIYGIAFSPDGNQLASGGYDNVLKLWDVNKGTLIREFKTIPLRPAPQVAARVVGVLASPHREGLLVAPLTFLASLDKKAFDKGHEDSIFSVAFSPDGKHLASGSGGLERVIKIWNIADATLVRDLDNPKLKRRTSAAPQSHPGWVYSLRYTVDGKRLVSAGDAPLNKGYLAVWDPASGKLLHGEEMSLGVFYSVALAPGGKVLAVGAGPRGRPTPELNSAYLLKMPETGK